MKVNYPIGKDGEDAVHLYYGFLLPNNVTRDEHESIDKTFRWVEKIAAVRAPAKGELKSLKLEVCAPRPQEITVLRRREREDSVIGSFATDGGETWKIAEIEVAEVIDLVESDLLVFKAKTEYLGYWRQNCYRMSSIDFTFADGAERLNREALFCKKSEAPKRLLFGDLHVHSNASLCSRVNDFGTLQENMAYELTKPTLR